MKSERVAVYILRAGVAFAFLYPPLNALGDPNAWIGYVPLFLKGYVADVTLLHAFGAFEAVIAFWILSGWRIFWPSAGAAVILLGIVAFNMPEFQVLFRDVSIAAMAFALAVISWGDEKRARTPGEVSA